MTHPLYTPSTARSPKTINFEPLQRGADAAEAAMDYMIAEQSQQQAAAALEAIVGSEEDRFKAAASKMEDSAHRAIEELDRQGREVGEEISQLVISSRSVRDQIAAGSIASGEALERLADLR